MFYESCYDSRERIDRAEILVDDLSWKLYKPDG